MIDSDDSMRWRWDVYFGSLLIDNDRPITAFPFVGYEVVS